jgi:hypothetical protein
MPRLSTELDLVLIWNNGTDYMRSTSDPSLRLVDHYITQGDSE